MNNVQCLSTHIDIGKHPENNGEIFSRYSS